MSDNSTLHSGSRGSAMHEERSRQVLIGTTGTVNTKGHEVLDAEGMVISTAAAIKSIEERNPDLVNVHSSVQVKYGVFIFGVGCAYFIDVLLFGATAEYVASLITGNWMLVLLAKYGIPLFFLGIEVLISLKMIEAREERDSEEVPSYGW